MLKYLNTEIVFQEVPDEISLAINITNCPCHCDGCHSPQLWENIGTILDKDSLSNLIKSNEGITCVLFLGGDSSIYDITQLSTIVKECNLKVAWYSGRNVFPKDLSKFDYIKIGPYIKSLGGLDNKNTNQRFYKVENGNLVDKTFMFQK